MSECIKCKFYNPTLEDCENEEWCKSHCRYDEPAKCEHYIERKKCEHKFENCDINGCSILCHSMPSERGCKFYYQCKLDGYPCWEDCQKHYKRKEFTDKKNELQKLWDMRKFIDELINKCQNDIERLKEEV